MPCVVPLALVHPPRMVGTGTPRLVGTVLAHLHNLWTGLASPGLRWAAMLPVAAGAAAAASALQAL